MRPIALFAALLLAAQPALAAAPVAGRWLTTEKDSIVEIAPCGAKLCGRVLRVLKRTPDGRPALDANNPDPRLRGRPVLGMAILTDFVDSGSVWTGRIYDPRNGKTYKSKLARNPDGTLKVSGCIAFFCKSFDWTRVR